MLVGRRSANHPQQVARRRVRDVTLDGQLFDDPAVTDHGDDRGTPQWLFDELDARHRFTIDVTASAHNTKCARYYTRDQDGLTQSWAGERVWCNPPYSDIRPWVEKTLRSAAEHVVLLLPANRTEQAWWQDLIEPERDRGGRIATRFLPGRPRFTGPAIGGPKGDRPPFGLVLLGWDCQP